MQTEVANRILRWVQTQRDDAVDLLSRMATAESPSNEPRAQEGVLSILSSRLQDIGYVTQLIPGKETGPHLYARPRVRRRQSGVQLILGHCDTVWPTGTLTEMPVEVVGERILGPGVFDMKGGLVQLVLALSALGEPEELGELGEAPELTPVILVNSDEEIGSPSSGRHIRRLARIARRAYVLEPALTPDGYLKTSRRGNGRFNVAVTGVSAHAGIEPGAGASAILELAHVIQHLNELNDAERGISINVGMVQGGVRPNVVAAESSAVVDVRVERLADVGQVERAITSIKATTPGTSVTITGRMGRPPMEANERNQALWKKARRLGGLLGLDLRDGLSGGSSDANTTSLFTPTLDGLGPVGDGAHAAHEFAYIDKMLERAALLALLMLSPATDTSVAPRP